MKTRLTLDGELFESYIKVIVTEDIHKYTSRYNLYLIVMCNVDDMNIYIVI